MQEKPTIWAYVITTILFIGYTTWAVYDYKKDPKSIPFEPIIAAFGTFTIIIGYLFWKNNQSESAPNSSASTSIQQNVHNNHGQVIGTVETFNNNATPAQSPKNTPK